ncbi:hypothetical protein N8654_04245 [Synechococcus sp. AH-601-B19]|nr:hypothetical protein [Synechococcus sp. AH-601-B19]
MKKVLLLGNSHVGAFKHAFSLVNSPNSSLFEFDFVAFASRKLTTLSISESQLCIDDWDQSKTFIQSASVIYSNINLKSYDIIVFVGGETPIDISHYVDFKTSIVSIPHFSTQVVEAVISTKFMSKNSLLTKLGQDLADHSHLVWVGKPPVISNLTLSCQDILNCQDLSEKIRDICSLWSCSSKTSFKFLFPRASVLNSHQFSLHESYCRGGLRFNGKARTPNNTDYGLEDHGNADYGKAMFLDLFHLLSNL